LQTLFPYTTLFRSLEPNLVPYFVDPATHWVLWHHPDDLPGDTELEPAAELDTTPRASADAADTSASV
jgi:hypothetical protein